MSDLYLWGIFLGVALGTFLLRLSFVEIHGRWKIPLWVQRALVYVPPSVLAALVVPAVLKVEEGRYDLTPDNPQVLAAVCAGLVAWYTRSTILTLAVGMAVLWTIRSVIT